MGALRQRHAWRGLAITIAVAGSLTALFVSAAVAPAARFGSPIVRTLALKNGTHVYTLRVPHTTGRRPPALLYSIDPPTANCEVGDYGYRARQARGELRLSLTCADVTEGKATVRFTKPIVRSFALANKTGVLDIRLDKPPGPIAPLLLLSTKPSQPGKCHARQSRLAIGRNTFSLHMVARCAGLKAGTRGILTVGGLLLQTSPRSLRVSVSAPRAPAVASASTAVTPTCEKTEKQGTARTFVYRVECEITLPGFWSGITIPQGPACNYLWSLWPGSSNARYWMGSAYRQIPENVGATWDGEGGHLLLDATNWSFESRTIRLSFSCMFTR